MASSSLARGVGAVHVGDLASHSAEIGASAGAVSARRLPAFPHRLGSASFSETSGGGERGSCQTATCCSRGCQLPSSSSSPASSSSSGASLRLSWSSHQCDQSSARFGLRRLRARRHGLPRGAARRGPRSPVVQPLAASPPPEVSSVSTEPLTVEDLTNHLRAGCKPKSMWRIGTEHEKFGFEMATLRPLNHSQIATILESLAERFDWKRVLEGDNIIGLQLSGQSVSLEPGGQFELSGAPVDTLHQTCAEVNTHLYQVKAVAEELNFGFLGAGFIPKWTVPEIPIMPKGRYDIMRNYMPKVGTRGLDMMFRTCTVQVNLDFESEQDMIDKFRVGLALQPIATALFANSPFKEGKPNGFVSYRSEIWKDVDNDRSGDLPWVFDEDFSFEKYVQYALDVPMYFLYRNKKYVNCLPYTFRDFMEGRAKPVLGETPTLIDWDNHLTTIFPEVRLKRFLEMRGADGGPWRRLCALPAFWVGLLYDEQALQDVLGLISDWTQEERSTLRNQVPKLGLQTPFRSGLLQHVAQEVFKISKAGLERRGFKESGFLRELEETVETGVTPAERLLKLYYGPWKESVDPIYEELLY
ncbi:hypothetical protein CBR_g17908 [Chara braunii]|uniref:glutamate--cysteine ligase n=1 Tax=Chara braunii TaxID=69332 RepID=A0A388KVV9_CHABU|nr:hypothetical protein CBR_g17908 [Chara braunii]|eukprot:GBG74196.1 hypothetical protein CBR_g17908 [Chara braunii]